MGQLGNQLRTTCRTVRVNEIVYQRYLYGDFFGLLFKEKDGFFYGGSGHWYRYYNGGWDGGNFSTFFREGGSFQFLVVGCYGFRF